MCFRRKKQCYLPICHITNATPVVCEGLPIQELLGILDSQALGELSFCNISVCLVNRRIKGIVCKFIISAEADSSLPAARLSSQHRQTRPRAMTYFSSAVCPAPYLRSDHTNQNTAASWFCWYLLSNISANSRQQPPFRRAQGTGEGREEPWLRNHKSSQTEIIF